MGDEGGVSGWKGVIQRLYVCLLEKTKKAEDTSEQSWGQGRQGVEGGGHHLYHQTGKDNIFHLETNQVGLVLVRESPRKEEDTR